MSEIGLAAALALGSSASLAAVHDVTQFGAIPDDNGDDTASLQRALDAATSRDTVRGEPIAGQPITFTNTSRDADGHLAHVLWDLGDGVPSSETNATHPYRRPGRYRVTLIVWDDGGRGAIREQSLVIK